MKFAPLLLAAALHSAMPAQAHHRHRSDSAAPAIIGGAILGGLLYLGTRDYDHHDHHGHHHHHRRHRRARIIDEYRYDGRQYRICRRGNDAFYC